MRKVDFLKSTLKCGVFSSSLLNFNVIENKINDSIDEYINNKNEKNTDFIKAINKYSNNIN